ncbi:MAG: DNA-directed RNA polymerase subunit alpha [Candidatus Latescibacterota bacterium]|nr:MAG: DNA-directed RNA polymerase subunit alpha [Candidatus Latescibacterota bacterium]
MKWKSLQMPKAIQKDEESYSPTYGKFVTEPLERGYGTTLGNALRRVLLSSLQGAAPCFVKIEGAKHEFTTLPGVFEDVTDIVLNLKNLVIRLDGDEPKPLNLDVEGPGEVTADLFEAPAGLTVLNPSLHIATLDKGASLKMQVGINVGRGYVAADQQPVEDAVIGVLPVDSLYSPVRRVTYRVEETRVGQKTDYDRLILEIWTNGTISPEDAVSHASKILKDHLVLFMNFEQEPAVEQEEVLDEKREALREMLQRSVDELELSVRSSNCLQSAEIRTIGDLVQKTEAEMLKYRNFGRKSLKEISDILRGMNLGFGMNVDEIVAQQMTSNPEP